MATAGSVPAADTADPAQSRLLRLPLGLADFARRGFRLDRPADRQVLETHARSFLTGFNLAARHWRDPHPALSTVTVAERGFAYEGAGMYTAVRSLLTPGDGGAFRRLCRGVGDDYIHLIHVGYGWAGAMVPIPFRDTVPSTPLLRWLALDGAGFARVYFGPRKLRTMTLRAPSERSHAQLAGAGRALWFVESASVHGVAAAIERTPHDARGELWAGIGLACCYAGCADTGALTALVRASGEHGPCFAQGAAFAIAARARSGHVPSHTEHASRHLFGEDPYQVGEWTDSAASGLTKSTDPAAYREWQSRLRRTTTAVL